jgi:hypothetical protein
MIVGLRSEEFDKRIEDAEELENPELKDQYAGTVISLHKTAFLLFSTQNVWITASTFKRY